MIEGGGREGSWWWEDERETKRFGMGKWNLKRKR
jgi:hypothetical protein